MRNIRYALRDAIGYLHTKIYCGASAIPTISGPVDHYGTLRRIQDGSKKNLERFNKSA